MGVEIVTKDDLEKFRLVIVEDIRQLLCKMTKGEADDIRGYKGPDVRGLLGCSEGKLKSLRTCGKIRTKKIGGTVYYNREDVSRLLTAGF